MARALPKLAGNSVAIAAAIIGLLSISFGWVTLRPNRLAAGQSMHLWEATDWYGTTVIVCLWVVCIILSLAGKRNLPGLMLGMTANVILILTFILAGFASNTILEGEPSFARVSPGAGIWITILAVFMLVFAARQRLADSQILRQLVSWSGLIIVLVLFLSGWLNNISIVQEFAVQKERFFQELGQHIAIFSGSVFIGTILGIGLGIWATRSAYSEKPIFFIANITQTIPSLALFGLLIAPLSALSLAFPILREFGIRGVGAAPALIALTIYSLLPIVRNTYVSLKQIEPGIIDAGYGMGMSRSQVFRRIEVPLSAPLVAQGVRTASIQAVSNTAVAALIGAGGLGHFIFRGLDQQAADLIILGAIPIIVLALIVDSVMTFVIKVVTPRGIKEHAR
jgi:osmoprotectant transport system permease protein